MCIDCSSTNDSFTCSTNLAKAPNNFYNANYEKCPSLSIHIERLIINLVEIRSTITVETQHSGREWNFL